MYSLSTRPAKKINFLLPFVCCFFFRAHDTNKQLRPSTRCARYYAKTPNELITLRVLIIADMRKQVRLWLPRAQQLLRRRVIFKKSITVRKKRKKQKKGHKRYQFLLPYVSPVCYQCNSISAFCAVLNS